jgi:hypothetical protein
MVKLPLTVTEITPEPGGLFGVRVAYADGTTGVFIVPRTFATVEAVTISATVLGMLADLERTDPLVHGPGHRRYKPRAAKYGGA